MFRRFLSRIDAQFTVQRLLKVIAVLSILYLLKATSNVWGNWISLFISIVQPFVLGFLLAFIIHPLIEWLEKKGISKNISIITFWILVIVLFVLLCVVIMPVLYDKITGFIGNLITGVEWIGAKIVQYGEMENFDLVENITGTITNYLSAYETWMPKIMSSIPGFMNSFLNVITNTLFTIIIAIYMLFDFQRIKNMIFYFFSLFHSKAGQYLYKIDEDVSVYIKSLLILMVIKFCEYSLFYYLIGHEDWIIIGFLSALGLLVPYLGGTLANAIGILTALTLSPMRIFFLIAGICVLSNVDAYLISPMIHEKRSSLGPLVTLLAVFAGGVLYGAVGIMFSVPVAIAIKAMCDVYKEDPSHKEEFL